MNANPPLLRNGKLPRRTPHPPLWRLHPRDFGYPPSSQENDPRVRSWEPIKRDDCIGAAEDFPSSKPHKGGGVLLSGSGRCKETSQKEMKESSREIVARLFRRDGDHFTSTIGRPVEMMPVWMVGGGVKKSGVQREVVLRHFGAESSKSQVKKCSANRTGSLMCRMSHSLTLSSSPNVATTCGASESNASPNTFLS